MILLPNGCSCSTPTVNPKNWKTIAAAIKKDWYIQYWFRDPSVSKKSKLVIVKGMNVFKTLTERREATKQIMASELSDLKAGYNPIKKTFSINESEISASTPFIEALHKAHQSLSCSHNTLLDIKSTIKHIDQAAAKLRFDFMPIGQVQRKHLKRILESCDVSNNTFNAYRKNLSILFKELLEHDAVEANFVRDISKKKTIKKIKKVLSGEEAAQVSAWAKEYDYRFYLLIHIFFHTGCRTTEIFRVRAKDVNLQGQTVLITVMKGNQPFEVLKPIKNIAVEFWEEAIEKARPDDFVFAKGLEPGVKQINPRQATRRWKRHIKDKLGIECDWYALKHLNTEQISAAEGIATAAMLNSHQSASTTKIYAIGEKEREMARIRKIANRFG